MTRIPGASRVERRSHERHAGGRIDANLAVSAMLAKFTARPLEEVSTGPKAGNPEAAQFFEVAQRGQIDVSILRLEPRALPLFAWMTKDRKRITGIAAEELRTRIHD